MTVTSKNLDNNGQPVAPAARRRDPSLVLAYIGVGLVSIAFGGVVWAINGGYSILGLEVLASRFNTSGAIFWAALTSITFPIPVAVPGAATTQPLLPWLGVIGISTLQITVIYRKLKGLRVPPFVLLVAVACSGYDVVTTYYGLGTSAWLKEASEVLRGGLAIVLSFTFETVLGFVLRRLLGRT